MRPANQDAPEHTLHYTRPPFVEPCVVKKNKNRGRDRDFSFSRPDEDR